MLYLTLQNPKKFNRKCLYIIFITLQDILEAITSNDYKNYLATRKVFLKHEIIR